MVIEGLTSVLNPTCLLFIVVGVTIGIIFGALPGLSATMAIALCLPLTFSMSPIEGISTLIGLYIGGMSGGLVSAILIKIPGTPSSIATTFDGGPMAEKGQAGKALNVALFYSLLGTVLSIVALIFISPTLAQFTLKFGPYEYFAVGVFSLTMVGSLVSGSVAKGLASCLLGLCLAQFGTAPVSGALRFTFGIRSLDNGFQLVSVLVGLFAVFEILKAAEEGFQGGKLNVAAYKFKGVGVTLQEFKSQLWNFIRSALIGIGIGILPGIGGGTSNLIAYSTAKNQSKYPEKFGTGIIDGVIASETANNATIGGAMIPLLTLGIPGDTATAMLLGALMLHGITTGPMLFQTNGALVYGIFAAIIIGTIAMYFIERNGMRLFIKVLAVPRYILFPIIMVLCCVGAFGTNNRVFDVFTVFLFGLIGYLLQKFGFSLTPILLGFILEPVIETNLLRGLMYSQGSFIPFLTSPIAAIFLAVAVLAVALTVRSEVRMNKKKLTTKVNFERREQEAC